MTAHGLVEYALHLRMYGENAPGGDETWATWDRAAERWLRGALEPCVTDGRWWVSSKSDARRSGGGVGAQDPLRAAAAAKTWTEDRAVELGASPPDDLAFGWSRTGLDPDERR